MVVGQLRFTGGPSLESRVTQLLVRRWKFFDNTTLRHELSEDEDVDELFNRYDAAQRNIVHRLAPPCVACSMVCGSMTTVGFVLIIVCHASTAAMALLFGFAMLTPPKYIIRRMRFTACPMMTRLASTTLSRGHSTIGFTGRTAQDFAAFSACRVDDLMAATANWTLADITKPMQVSLKTIQFREIEVRCVIMMALMRSC